VVIGHAQTAIVALGGIDHVLVLPLGDGFRGADIFTAAAFNAILKYLVRHGFLDIMKGYFYYTILAGAV
jgi:hypothetical protein